MGNYLVPANPRETERLRLIKTVVVVLLCFQNSLYSLLRRYSQGVLREAATPSSILLGGEILKLLFSWYIIVRRPNEGTAANPGLSQVQTFSWLLGQSAPMLVPAVVYLIMNLLSYVAIQRIDAGLFTVFAQCKVLTTAVFSRIVMGKSLHLRKWRALLLVVLGTMLISVQTKPVARDAFDPANIQFLVGVGAVCVEVTLSGFISVYFEKVLKGSSAQKTLTVWDRNVQLAVFSIAIYAPIAIYDSPPGGVFSGWSMVTCWVSILGATGGVLVALCVKYTDSIIKSIATSGAIVSTTFAGHVWLEAPLDIPICIGAICVILSIFNYNDEGDTMAAQSLAVPNHHMPLSSQSSPLMSSAKPSHHSVRVLVPDNVIVMDGHANKHHNEDAMSYSSLDEYCRPPSGTPPPIVEHRESMQRLSRSASSSFLAHG